MKFEVLSLFDGISVARIACERAGISVTKYYASEIDKYAIQIAQKNYPDTIQLGDIRNINGSDFRGINLLIGGFPCQDLSISKKNREGLKGERSCLFWEMVRIHREIESYSAKFYWVYENVASMPKEDKEVITKTLGVEPIMINASLVSAQNRKRFFWTNILCVKQPEDKKIYLKDIIQQKNFNGLYSDYNNKCIYEKSYTIGTGCGTSRSSTFQQVITKPIKIAKIGKGGQGERVYSIWGKSTTLSALGGGRGAKTGLYAVKDFVRKLTPIECERLQSLPDNFTKGISDTQRYRCLGNAFNANVVAYILSFIPKKSYT